MPRLRTVVALRLGGLLALLLTASGAHPACAADGNWNPMAALNYSRKHGGTVLLISRPGMADFADFEPGFHARSPLPVFSITKSLTALTCLTLEKPRPTDIVRNSRTRREPPLTLGHLLTQTSGISPGYEQLYKKNIPDVRKVASSLPSVSAPGTRFAYGPAHYEIIGSLLNPADKSPDVLAVALARFLKRVGIRPAAWRTDRRGHPFLSAGAVLTPQDLKRLGQFVLECSRGRCLWPVIPKKTFQIASTGSGANPAYGMGFWLNRAAGNATPRDIEEAISIPLTREDWSHLCLSNRAPRDLICMAGSGGQRIYVIPSLQVVVVRLGRHSGFKDPGFLNALFSSRQE